MFHTLFCTLLDEINWMNCLCSRACVCVCLCGLKLIFFLSLIHPSQMPFHLVCFVIIKLAIRSSVSNQSLSIIQFRICFHVLKDLLIQFSTRILHQQNQNYRFVYFLFLHLRFLCRMWKTCCGQSTHNYNPYIINIFKFVFTLTTTTTAYKPIDA